MLAAPANRPPTAGFFSLVARAPADSSADVSKKIVTPLCLSDWVRRCGANPALRSKRPASRHQGLDRITASV